MVSLSLVSDPVVASNSRKVFAIWSVLAESYKRATP